MSDSVRPHRRQPTRLPRPRDSPGKNTGVCCHFLLQRMKVKSESEVAQLCPTLSDPMDCSLPGSSAHDFPGKSTGVGCRCLLHLGAYRPEKKSGCRETQSVKSEDCGLRFRVCCWGIGGGKGEAWGLSRRHYHMKLWEQAPAAQGLSLGWRDPLLFSTKGFVIYLSCCLFIK